MTVTFRPPPKRIRQIVWSCRAAGIPCVEATHPLPSISCHFDDAVEAFAWHRTFVYAYGWAPYDYEESTADEPFAYNH